MSLGTPSGAATSKHAVRVRQVGLLALVTATAVAGFAWYGLRHEFNDLTIYIDAMRWWDGGHPLYEFAKPDATQGQLGYTYPPFTAMLMRPMAWLRYGASLAIVMFASAAMLSMCVWLLTRPLAERLGWPGWLTFGLALVLASGLEPIRETFMLGQVNAVLWALILLDLLVLAPRHSRLVGVGIGLATAIKLTPAIFVVYLLVTRRWRAAGVAVGTAAAASLLAAALAPRDSWTYWTQTLLRGEGVGAAAYEFNQSVMGVLARIAQPDEPNPLLWLLLIAPIAGYGMWRAGRAASAGDEVAGLTLAGFVGSLVSPVTWVHHIFWFVPALVVLIRAHGRRAWSGPLAAALFCYATVTFSMISLWAFQVGRPGGVAGFVLTNWLVWLMLGLLVLLPFSPVPSPVPISPTPISPVPTADDSRLWTIKPRE